MTQLIHLWLWLATISAPPHVARLSLPPDSGEVHVTLDSTLAAAGEALTRGRPWQATRLLSEALRDSSNRTPAAVFLAARAASEWGGWSEVLQLLSTEPWIDSLYEGRARVLLTRGALELNADSVALVHAQEAVRRDSSSGERLMLFGNALARNQARDSAAAVLTRAAARLPAIADWIRVHAASVTADSGARAQLYQSIVDSLPRGRIPWAEATAHENTGDLVEAARRYAEIGEHITSLRLRLASSPDSAPRAVVRRELLKLVRSRLSPGAARQVIALLDSAFTPLDPAEQLLVARAAARAGLPSRAVAGFARAGNQRLGAGEDRFAYASALTRLKRNREAAAQFRKVRASRSLVALSAYQGARALVRDGQLSRGRKALVGVTKDYPREIEPASSAYFLLADLASDDRQDVEARRLYGIVANQYPTSRFAPNARFRAAMIALLSEKPKLAAQEFDLLAERHPASNEAVGALYWAGRAWAASGDSVTARSRWETVAAREPLSYYAVLSARRLGNTSWSPPAARDTFLTDPVIDRVVSRAELLTRLGMKQEARWELNRLARSADSSSERLLAIADAFRSQGMASQGIQLARRALALGAPADARTFRLIYPMAHRDALLAETAGHGIDPTFVAALIRQESNFNPAATSPAGARGLAQVMPDLGERLAKELKYPLWDPVLLYQPDVSIQLGAFHLRELVSRYDQRAHILAAYNAGSPRVERWSKRIGVDDPEVFAERISFVETRDYVRIIQSNVEIYRGLYGSDFTGLVEAAQAVPLIEDVAGDQKHQM